MCFPEEPGAPGSSGKHIYLHKFTDYLSQAYEKLDYGMVSDSGRFTLKADISEVTEAFIQIEDKSGSLYLDPKNAFFGSRYRLPDLSSICMNASVTSLMSALRVNLPESETIP